MMGQVDLDHAMSDGAARSSAGPTTVTHSYVAAHTASQAALTTAACARSSIALTTAPLYPGCAHG
jgi:hypothetical protein